MIKMITDALKKNAHDQNEQTIHQVYECFMLALGCVYMRSVRFVSIWIGFNLALVLLNCAGFMVSVPRWNGILPNWITFTSNPIWYPVGEPI